MEGSPSRRVFVGNSRQELPLRRERSKVVVPDRHLDYSLPLKLRNDLRLSSCCVRVLVPEVLLASLEYNGSGVVVGSGARSVGEEGLEVGRNMGDLVDRAARGRRLRWEGEGRVL